MNRSGPWCKVGYRTYAGRPFKKDDLRLKANELGTIFVRFCSEADDDHARSVRQYAHVFCQKQRHGVVCVARAFVDLPRDHRDGLLAHEIGHLLADPIGSEPAADEAFRVLTGARVYYKSGDHGECLQYLKPADSRRLEGRFKFDLDFEAKVRKSNPDELEPVDRREFLPSRVGEQPVGQFGPPRTHFDLIARGKAPLVYLPEGRALREDVAKALEAMLTGRAIADPNAWERLYLMAKRADADLFVVDRQGERWHVRDVLIDFGGETGQLALIHVGARSRSGEKLVDVMKGFGFMVPVVVFRAPKRGGSKESFVRDEIQADFNSLYKTLHGDK